MIINWVWRLVPAATFDKHQVAYALSPSSSVCFANSMILGSRSASITNWIGGSSAAERSFLIPMIP